MTQLVGKANRGWNLDCRPQPLWEHALVHNDDFEVHTPTSISLSRGTRALLHEVCAEQALALHWPLQDYWDGGFWQAQEVDGFIGVPPGAERGGTVFEVERACLGCRPSALPIKRHAPRLSNKRRVFTTS